ncbi:hypothetical protein C7212DRAFT_176413, partial [Tuber magnatum]
KGTGILGGIKTGGIGIGTEMGMAKEKEATRRNWTRKQRLRGNDYLISRKETNSQNASRRRTKRRPRSWLKTGHLRKRVNS